MQYFYSITHIQQKVERGKLYSFSVRNKGAKRRKNRRNERGFCINC